MDFFTAAIEIIKLLLAMDFFTAAIEIIKLLWDPLCRQTNYVLMFRKNLTELKNQRDRLLSKENDVYEEIARAKSHGKEPTNVVQDWLISVANVKKEICDIENEENKKCFKNCLPDYCSRLKVSRRSLELIGELEGLINKCPSKDDVAHEALPATKHTFATAPLFGEGEIEAYKKQIWECLENENIGKIGVYGMGGVGKSTIMAHINNDLKNTKHFGSVLWVTVSKEELNLKRLQSDVARAINLQLSNEHDEKIRSSEIFEKFSETKKFLLILDDLWEAFSLEDIGIPEPVKKNGSKMVLTTRSLKVCDGMETQKNIEVCALGEGYAWDLFSSKVENDVLSKPEILEVAKLVAKECKGLPLALITVGRALRNAKDVCLWRHALKELRDSTPKTTDIEDKVFKQLKFSYARLRDDDVRACFLYCSLFPEDYKIKEKELIKLWEWEALLKGDGDEEVMDEGYSILNELKNACMLERVPCANDDDDEEVKMHDLIRDVAIGITRDNPCFMVKTGVGLKEQPKEEEFLENIERISLSRNNIASLIGQPNCPKLRTLFLNDSYQFSSISSSFFLYMHSVRVLDLSKTGIKALPESLSDLVNLHALLLEGCRRLVVLPSLAKLKELRILNLSQTGIEELPPGMEGLIKLRYLDLSWTYHLKTIRVGIFLQLSALEELSFRRCSWKFDLTNREAETIINEILGLKRLDKLSINFVDMRSFLIYHESDHWRSLHKFVSSIWPTKEKENDAFCNFGMVCMWTDDTNHCSVLHFDDPHLEIVQCWCNLVIPQVLIDSRAFKRCDIRHCTCTEYIFKGGEDSSLSAIETLTVGPMKHLKSISKEVIPCGALANLKVLILSVCNALEHVFTASIIVEVAALRKGEHHGILQSLRILEISFCDRMKTLFSSDLLQCLQNIEEIKIYECSGMKQMVVEEANGAKDTSEVKNITGNAISLPRLRVLKLLYVLKLKCICKRMLICNSLQQIQIRDCPRLSSLPLSIENPTAIVDGFIKGSGDWWNALEWEDLNTKRILQPLFEVGNIWDDSGDDSETTRPN